MEELKQNKTETGHEAEVADSLGKINIILDSLSPEVRVLVEKELRSKLEGQTVQSSTNHIDYATQQKNAEEDQARVAQLHKELGIAGQSPESTESGSESVLSLVNDFESKAKLFGFNLQRAASQEVRDQIIEEAKITINNMHSKLKDVVPSLKTGQRANDQSLEVIVGILDQNVEAFNRPGFQKPEELARLANSILTNSQNIAFRIRAIKNN